MTALLLIACYLPNYIMNDNKNQFGSRIGLIAATVGSAVGLGNIWRFPAEAQSNGGAAFLLLYVLCVALLGVPVMLAEMSLGRQTRRDAYGTFKTLAPRKKWYLLGYSGIITAYLIGSYYMVVTGWTLEYLFEAVTGQLFHGAEAIKDAASAGADNFFRQQMDTYISTPVRPIVFTSLVILANMAVLSGGVQKGIERLSNVLMPLLFVVLVAMCCLTLSLPGAGEGLRWFFTPDFSKISASTVINAMGQTFFSLSLGMGTLITYAAYYPKDTNLTQTSSVVALMSTIVAVLMGLVIFPAVSSFGLQDHSLVGTTLVFQTLPEVFMCLPWPMFWASLFFALLFMAALTSTVSIMEVAIAFLVNHFRMGRVKASVVTLSPLLALSALCSLSFSSLSGFTIMGMTIFDLLDTLTTNVMLPVTSLGICIYVGWFAPHGLLRDQLSNHGTIKGRITGLVRFIIKYVAPLLILAILLSPLFK